MKNRQNIFLEQFDSEFRNHIIEFGKRISDLSKKNDLLIFMARKAACLADCMEQVGLMDLHCITASSRILNFNLEWLKDKRIAIIDDTLISGTTLYQVKNRLIDNQINEFSFNVLCVDSYWWNSNLVKPEKPFVELKSESVIQVCSQIVNSIAIIPRPYSIDFPIYKSIRFQLSDFEK